MPIEEIKKKEKETFSNYEHLEQMEGYRTMGYIVSGTDSSGITIGFGIDLSQPPYNTAEGLKKVGFSEDFINNVVKLDILGKDVGTLKRENRNPSELAKKVTLPNDEQTKQKQFEIVKNSITKRTQNYQGTMDSASLESYATLTHWGGTPMNKADRDKIEDPNKLGAYSRKAYVFGIIQDTIDDVIKKNGSINSEQYQAAILSGKNSISNFENLSPLNTQTLNREVEFVADSSGTSVTNENYEQILSSVGKEKKEIPRVPSVEALEEIKKKEAEVKDIKTKDFDSSDIETDYNREFNKLDKLKKRQEEEKKEETELSIDEDPVEDKIETEEERIAREKQERIDSLAVEKAAEEEEQRLLDEYSKEQTELLKEKEKKEREDLVIDEEEVVDEEVVDEEVVDEEVVDEEVVDEEVEEVVDEEPEMVQVEVLDSQGNIKIIETPAFQPKKEEVEITDEQPEEEVEVTDEQPEEIVEEELVKPKMEDFRTENNMFNAKEYFKALKKYKKNIKDQPETEGPIVLDGELDDDEVKQLAEIKEGSEIIDGKKQNVFNIDEGENILDFVIGNVEKALTDITDNITKSLKVEDDFVDLTGQELIISDSTTASVAPSEISEIDSRVSQEEQAVTSMVAETFGQTEPKGRVVNPTTYSIEQAEAKKKAELDRIRELQLTGNKYYEYGELLDEEDVRVDKNTIKTLATRNPEHFNINENDVVTDNNGNVIATKDDWLEIASRSEEEGGLGWGNSDQIYHLTSKQFKSPEYQYMQHERKRIDKAYNYLISTYYNEAGDATSDIFGLGIPETINFGEFNKEMKREILNMIDNEKLNKYATHDVGLRKFTTLMKPEEKQAIVNAAKMKILNRQMAIVDKAHGKLKVRGDAYEVEANKFMDKHGIWTDNQKSMQKELDRIRRKYGKFLQTSSGEREYQSTVPISEWDKIDQTSWKNIDDSLVGVEKERVGLRILHGKLKTQRDNYNRDIKNLQSRQEDIFAALLWNAIDRKFEPAFQQVQFNKDWNELTRARGGKGLDVLSAFTEEFIRLKVLIKAGSSKLIKRGVGYAFAGAYIADITNEIFEWEKDLYEFAPSDKSEFSEGYSNVGMLFDLMLGISGKDFLPSSADPEGEVIDFDYKPTFKHENGALEWAGQLYQQMAPKSVGGHGTYTGYSTSKAFARLLPYTLNIMSAYKGVGAKSKAFKSTLSSGKHGINRSFNLIGQQEIGKKITSSLSKSWVSSERMMGTMNMIRVNHKMTLLDNIADGRARGLDRGAAFAYGNFLSLATGLSQSIMPDYNWISTLSGKAILKKLRIGLKSTGQTVDKIGRREITEYALKQAGKNFLKEHIEEQTDVFLQDVVKSGFIANHSWEIADVRMQAEVLSGTTILTLPLGGISTIRTRRNLRQTVYGYMRNNSLKVIRNGNQEKKVIIAELDRINNLFLSDDVHLSNKQRIRKKQLENQLKLINKNIDDATTLHKVIQASPKHVTDTQIDLLVQKEKLLKRKQDLNKDQDKVFNTEENAKIDEEIEGLDKQIEEHGIKKYHDGLYTTLLENVKALAGKVGVKLFNIPYADPEKYAEVVQVEMMRRRDWNEEIDKRIAALDTTTEEGKIKATQLENRKYTPGQLDVKQDGPGFILYDDINGRHHIITNEKVAKENNNEAVLLHEFLHAVLYKAMKLSPNSVKGLSFLLREELINDLRNNKGRKYGDIFGYITQGISLAAAQRGETDPLQDPNQRGKYDQYMFEKEINDMAPDELFNIFVEALAQGNIKVESNFINKIGDSIRRLLREAGINFQITGVNGLVNFLKDYNHEVLSDRTNFSRGMQTIMDTGKTNRTKYFGKNLFAPSKGTIAKATELEKIMMFKYGVDAWDPKRVLGMSIKHKGRFNIYRDKKLNEDLELTDKTKAIVAENARIRQLILDEGLKRGNKIVASEDLQNQLIENNLPAAVALAKFAANNPNMMGLEKGKRVTYDQFVSGYYEQLTKLAGTYDASVNEFGQYMNTILPRRYGDILEAEKVGAIEGSVGLDAAADIAIDDDTTPDDIQTGPVVDTAERFGIKQDTKPFIDKGLKQLKKLRRLQEKLAEEFDEKTANELAELTADLESKGMADLDVDLDIGKITVKQAPNLLYKFVAKLFGIDEDKLNPNSGKWLANLRKDESKRWGSNEVRAAQRAVLKHIDVIMSTVFNEGHTAAFKSSGMPNSLLKFGYNKSSKKIKGNYPQYKKPNLSAIDLLKFIGVEKVKGKYVFTVDRNTGTKLLAIASMTDRNMSLQGLNEGLEASGDMNAKIKNSIQDGLSNANYSKSIIYKQNKEIINQRLPALANALEKVNGDWTYKNVVDIFINTFDGALSKGDARKFAKDAVGKTGVLFKYLEIKRKFKEAGYSFDKFNKQRGLTREQALFEYVSKELPRHDDYESHIMRFLGMDEDMKIRDAFTIEQIERGRNHVGELIVQLNKDYLAGKISKEKAQLQIRILREQHASASQVGDGSIEFIPGTDIWVETNKKGRQSLQLFNNNLDFSLWINNFLHPDLQVEIGTKEVTKNDVTRTVYTSIKADISLETQKKKEVLKEMGNKSKKGKKYSQKRRKKESKEAEEITIKQIQHYYKRLIDPNDNFNKLDFAMHMLTFGSSMDSASRRAAELVGIQDGLFDVKTGKYVGGKYKTKSGKYIMNVRYEHGKPHSFIIQELIQILQTEKDETKWNDLMSIPFIDYKVNLITIPFDNTLDPTSMGFGYGSGKEHGWVYRLFSRGNMGDSRVGPIRLIDDVINGRDGIIFGEDHYRVSKTFMKSNSEIEVDKKVSNSMQSARSIKYNHKLKGITILDFDDTLATTKSGVRYRLPNPTGEPQPSRKVIFLAGAPGAGKSNVVKQLDLVGQGFNIVNSDISLEWLKKNSGLPADMKDLTSEQLSKLGKLQWEARQIALRKKMKFQGKGDGIVVDGTGASLNVMKKQVQEFKDKGYDVQMVFIETSLETAQERNRARKERSLTTKIVETTWNSVQGNKKAFKELFGDNFSEVNTDKLKQNDPMPAGLVTKMDAFTKGYIKGRLNAGEYADKGAGLAAQGAEFDFTEFDKVIDGVIAPLFNKALKLAKKFGTKNMFILTARPAEAQQDIYEFLKSQGLEIPIKNIVGLGNSTAEAKALWVAEKANEGYNDFYFADDALQNVQAVENVLGQLDVKSKIQRAKVSKSIKYSQEFNEILENTSGVDAGKRFSRAKARKRGEDKGKFKFFIPPSGEDLVGLFYNFLGKGKVGDEHFKWFKEVFVKPLNRAYQELNSAKQAIANDYKQLGKEFEGVRKKLYKKIGGTEFTNGDAIRVYLWNKADFYIPGLSESDKNELINLIESNSELKAYADALGIISKQKEGYVKPSDNWMVEDIRVDLMNATSTINRKVFFQEFIENADIVFSEENLNKIEAIYGRDFREALEDMLYRVKNGTNRNFGSNRLVNRFMNWINGSIGVTMHFNSRSAILQSLSMVNFINWTDNNMIAAAKAFANPKQFWADFTMIFNSDMLKQRRAGLSIDINANEIANYVSNSKKPYQSALNWLLQKGFLPTQMMDSFAIAAGGATFYRNRLNTYLSQGLDETEAKKKAFEDFQVIAEETQQSARPDMISMQQASVLGRLILAFQNTPIQYARLMKKAISDLANGRGDVKTNVSKIVYYGAVQNLIFYSMQTALFAMMFGDDEDDEEFFDKKRERVMNGSLDSLLRGMGVGGAVVSTLKNMLLKFIEQQDKPRYKRDEYAVLMEMLNLSPPIGIKARHMLMAQRNINWNEDTIKQMPLYNLDNPLWESAFLTTQSITNIPLARIQTKVNNLREATNKENAAWQRIAMFLGWSKWNLGIKDNKKTKRKRKKSSKKMSLSKKRTYAY